MSSILVVDDEERIREMIKKYAIFEGYEVTEAGNGLAATEICKTQTFDLVIMDVMMPELDGFSTVKEIRKSSDVPVIMLSARGEEYDKIHGFEIGIDDYVVKPFSPKELMMRVGAILKRVGPNQSDKGDELHDIYDHQGLHIDFTARLVTVDGIKVDLALKEYDLLVYMITNRNIALSREMLLTKVWGYDYYGDDRTLDTHIKMLRKYLGPYNHMIITIRGVGYRFEG